MSKKKHDVREELLAGLLANYKNPEDLIGEEGLMKHLTKLVVERALEVELSEHMGHEKHGSVANESSNTRNGKSRKTLKGEFGELPIEVPRDRRVGKVVLDSNRQEVSAIIPSNHLLLPRLDP